MSVKISFDNGSSEYQLERWFVGEGVAVSLGQDLAMIRADDELHVLQAPMSGIFLAKRIENEASFEPEDTIGLILSHEEAGDIKVTDKLTLQDRRILDSLHNIDRPASRLKQPVHVKATPSARREARENKIDLRQIMGTGPNGRVQLSDVIEYKTTLLQRKEVRTIDNKPVYNLPLTPLAEHLIREHGLDASLIPAPSGAKRLRKSDVERYLKNPQEAARIIEEEQRGEDDLMASLYQSEPAAEETEVPVEPEEEAEPETEAVETEAEPEVEVEETEEVETEAVEVPEEVEAESKTEEIEVEPETEAVETEAEPEVEVETEAEAVETEELEAEEPAKEEPLQIVHEEELRLEEPPEDHSVIRLSTVEPVIIASDDTILLGEEAQMEAYYLAHLAKLAVLDLKKLDITKREEGESILGYARKTILKGIVEALEGMDVSYLPDIRSDEYYDVAVEDNKLVKNPISPDQCEDFVIVDLLSSKLTDVSGIVDSENGAVLYFSYVCQLSDLLGGSESTKSLLSLVLDFDTSVYSPDEAIEIFDAISDKIESIDEVN